MEKMQVKVEHAIDPDFRDVVIGKHWHLWKQITTYWRGSVGPLIRTRPFYVQALHGEKKSGKPFKIFKYFT